VPLGSLADPESARAFAASGAYGLLNDVRDLDTARGSIKPSSVSSRSGPLFWTRTRILSERVASRHGGHGCSSTMRTSRACECSTDSAAKPVVALDDAGAEFGPATRWPAPGFRGARGLTSASRLEAGRSVLLLGLGEGARPREEIRVAAASARVWRNLCGEGRRSATSRRFASPRRNAAAEQ
jgi:hypothetical protein